MVRKVQTDRPAAEEFTFAPGIEEPARRGALLAEALRGIDVSVAIGCAWCCGDLRIETSPAGRRVICVYCGRLSMGEHANLSGYEDEHVIRLLAAMTDESVPETLPSGNG